MSGIQQSFGKWRDRIWPIHSFELKKFLPLILMKFLFSLNYGILTCLKDTMVVTSKGAGAEAIPVLKGWIVLPIAIIASLSYSKLSNYVKKTTLFYITMGTFLLIIVAYGFILCPYADFFSPNQTSDWLINTFGARIQHWVSVYRNWIHSLLFVTAELWGSMVILLIFWGFANDVSSVSEAKRTYTIYIAAGNLGPILTGPFVYFITRKYVNVDFLYTIQILTGVAFIIGLLSIAIYWWTNKYVLTDKRFYDPQKLIERKEKLKLSLRQSLKHIARSKYLMFIAILVVGYGLAINLIEVTWKAEVKLLYPNPADFQSFTASVFSLVGVTAFFTSLLFCGGIIRSKGWHFTAQITPFVIGVTGLTFFALVLKQDSLGPYIQSMLGISPLLFIVLFGAFQNISSKMVKYSFFDPTKEMAYIPLSNEEKIKGKASIDVVGSRLGKSGSAWIQIALIDLIGCGSVLSITPYLIPVVLITVVGWMLSIRSLNKQFSEKADENNILETSPTA
ncbi:MAG: NTP/NDP exchange transporter [Chlamydiales bacterium]|nr:NTP/NDP exchange transporter [Chlamydiales bacterium]